MRTLTCIALCCACCLSAAPPPQASTAGTLEVAVLDPSGAAVSGARVEVENRVTGYRRLLNTRPDGTARLANIPPGQYHLQAGAPGFQPEARDFSVRGAVPITIRIALAVAAERTEVEVHSDTGDLIEPLPTAHIDLDRSSFVNLPRRGPGQGLSDLITLATPGVTADSNGMFHPLGDHAETGFALDNQPITDQVSKQFSNQLPLNIIQSVEVISGAAPAEFGDKASLVVNAITRSGLGFEQPFGDVRLGYGSFGTPNVSASAGWGGAHFGEFLAVNATRSGRYLDTPEFTPLHAAGNNQQIFNRLDYQPSERDNLHLNLFLARSWFQTPNTWDQQFSGQDQRQKLLTYNVAAGWVHTVNPTTLLTFNPYVRQDQSSYYPSRDILADSPATVSQRRRLLNFGTKTDIARVSGRHNFKSGIQAQRYVLRETFSLAITDPGYVDEESPGLIGLDLTRGGKPFTFDGRRNIDQLAWFAQDSITLGGLTANLGIRYDWYSGLVRDAGWQPRIGLSYLFEPSSTVLRASYSRFFVTPYNENLIASSSTGARGLEDAGIGAYGIQPIRPGRRNQFNAGFQQGIARRIVFDADYFWKFTRNAFDFDTLFNSPIQFPIEWRRSKIDGLSLRLTLTPIRGFSAYTVAGHTRARFFGPENGGILFNSPLEEEVFRIDHDQAFQQTTSLRYHHEATGWWANLIWRYDSGMVAGRVPDRETALSLSAFQQIAIGLSCGAAGPLPGSPLRACPEGQPFQARLIRIPEEGAFHPDHNPARIAGRNLFDISIGTDNLLRAAEGPRWTLALSAVNVTNKAALYNFLSTFSGTHFVSPRTLRAEIGLVF